MSRPKKYSEADRILWWKLYVAGVSIPDIAKKFECSYTVVRYELFGEWKPKPVAKPARSVRQSVQQELRA
jgi:transposase